MKLADLRTFGRSGLLVSPLALGTMTMGRQDWGSPDDVSRAIFDAYLEAGGNFIDTANVYSDGNSETLLGEFIAERKLREKIVLATKMSFNDDPDDAPLWGGNGSKNVHRALDASLQRLQTDHIDLYWMHVWDRVTPVEEVLETFGNLVRAGKIRYFGFSDVPAWYAARAVTLARDHGIPGPIALQLPYSLIERHIEREHVPLASDVGLGIAPWSPLGFGFLSGKYDRDKAGANGNGDGGRLHSSAFGFDVFTERNWKILDALARVAKELGKPVAQVALAWVVAQRAITSTIIGASKVEQLHDNLASLDLALGAEHERALTDASALEDALPYSMFDETTSKRIFGGATVTATA